MLMLVLLFDLIIFLASASKFLVWVGPSSCFKSTQCRGKHNWDLYIYIYIYFFHQQNGLIWKLVQT